MAIIKRTEIMYKERNKLFIESGLGDYAYSDAEIGKFISEAVDKEVANRINNAVKGL
tara:strand:- start:287 stop:457 length:171 start_codon:yes stop_codon:yes gene_type:complete